MKKITEITRSEIFQAIKSGFISYHCEWKLDDYENQYCVEEPYDNFYNIFGKLDEIKFFKRIFDLESLPSTDIRYKNALGDIIQHTCNNDDFEKFWFLSYPSFDLKDCDDEILLKFLCEIFHPAVRVEKESWHDFLKYINSLIEVDGYILYPVEKISGRNVYGWKSISEKNEFIMHNLESINKKFDSDYMNSQMRYLLDSVDENPVEAIGKSKELIESCCKTILENRNVEVDKNWNISQLSKKTFEALQLMPKNIPNNIKCENTIKQILGNLSAISNGISELRNDYGSGHGKSASFKGLSSRHANLAVGATTTLVHFLWNTYEEQTKRITQ